MTKIGADGRRKRVADATAGPWVLWPETDLAERAIRFIETYCRTPKGFGHGELIRLADFQKDWLRRVLRPGVSSAIMALPRGNGKSTFLAAVAVWAVFDPGPGGAPQVPIVATAVHQAIRTTYGVAVAMIDAEPELADRCIQYTAIGATKVVVPFTGGELFPIANTVDGLQGLDPSLAICDEVGFMAPDSWNSLVMAGIKRPRSLVAGIGTPGLDEDNALWFLRQRVGEGSSPPGFDFTEFAAAEGCAVDDEDEWRRANPAIDAGYLNIDAMRTNLGMTPEGRFRVFHLGQWVDGIEAWLGPDASRLWDSLRAPYLPVSGVPTWVGVDVGLKRDSTAVVAVQRRPDGRMHAWAKIWVPTPSRPNDVFDAMHYIRGLGSDLDIAEICYDPKYFDVPAQMLGDEGYTVVEISQTAERMIPACGALYRAIQHGELTHDGDRAFTHQVLNAVARQYETGFTLSKMRSRARIDAAVALVLAFARARLVEAADAFVV